MSGSGDPVFCCKPQQLLPARGSVPTFASLTLGTREPPRPALPLQTGVPASHKREPACSTRRQRSRDTSDFSSDTTATMCARALRTALCIVKTEQRFCSVSGC